MKESAKEQNNIELINPLPDTIPNIVWDDLLYSDKEKILDAVKSKYTVTYHSDTGEIKIKKTKGLFRTVSIIRSRATSERGIFKLENPVPDTIPRDIWNNLPNVLKEEIIKRESFDNKYPCGITYKSNNRYSPISYNPDKNTITIHTYNGSIEYDAKGGKCICISIVAGP